MISAIDFLKEWQDCCDSTVYCDACMMKEICFDTTSYWTDKKIIQAVKNLEERKKERENSKRD